MILQCDQCNTKFKLDDSKIKAGGVKVRCSKCKHVFVVNKEVPQDEADFDSILNGLGTSTPAPSSQYSPAQSGGSFQEAPGGFSASAAPEPAAASGETASAATVAAHPSVPETRTAPEEEGFDFSEFSFSEEPAPAPDVETEGRSFAAGFEPASFEFDMDEGLAAAEKQEPGPLPADVGADAFSFSEEPVVPQQEDGFAAHEQSLESFDFPSLDLSADTEPMETMAGAAGKGFTLDLEGEEGTAAVMAEVDYNQTFLAEALSAKEETPGVFFEPVTPGLSDFSSPSVPEIDVNPELALTGETEPVDFGALDFGKVAETVTVEKKAASMEPVAEIPPPVMPLPGKGTVFVPPPVEPFEGEDLPPLSITSRRKGSSIFLVSVIAVSLLVVTVLAGAGFFFLKEGPTVFNRFGLGFMAPWFGMAATEEGSISVRNTAGSYVINKEAGELFVINGEAVNNFKKPRATINVKVVLFGKNGAVIAHKTAYCGNQLSREQLATLPLAKIEASMNNQFGDSLSNLGVAPGKGIPFVVVFANVPKDVMEFGVEVAGSTVASQ